MKTAPAPRLRTGNGSLAGTPAAPPEHNFIATGDARQFEALARRFLGPEVLSVRHVDHVAAQYPTGSLARITPEMIAAAQSAASRPRISNFVGQGAGGSAPAGGPAL